MLTKVSWCKGKLGIVKNREDREGSAYLAQNKNRYEKFNRDYFDGYYRQPR